MKTLLRHALLCLFVSASLIALLQLSSLSSPSWVIASNENTQPSSFAAFGESREGAGLNYRLDEHQTLSRVVLLVRENYVDPSRVDVPKMFVAALENIEKSVPEVIVDASAAPKVVKVSAGEQSRTFKYEKMTELWEMTMALRDIFQFLQTHIQDPEVRQEIEYTAINGMLSTLDPHTVLLRPQNFDEMKMSTKGKFGGLGIVVSMDEGQLTVVSPLADTPASKTGIEAKDQIMGIGEESTAGMSLEDAVAKLRGDPGTKVELWILRKGWSEPKKFLMERAIVRIKSVTSKLLAKGVGYVQVKSFQGNTATDLKKQLNELRNKNGKTLSGLVLDLRNNPGGLLDQAIAVSDLFIEKGPLVVTVGDGNKHREVRNARNEGDEWDFPMVVLVNGGSASAAEIVAGALQNHDRAVILGEQTFGKGSVQVLYDFRDRSALKLTIAQYLTPGDVSIQTVGIRPDVVIQSAEINKDKLAFFLHDKGMREKDLDQHLENYEKIQTGEKKQAQAAVNFIHLSDVDEAQKLEVRSGEEFQMDYEIQVAQELLEKSKGIKRQELLSSGKLLFKDLEQKEAKSIEKRFQTLGVNWGSFPQSENAKIKANFSILHQGKPETKLYAGDEVTLELKVTNQGEKPLTQVFATTKSKHIFLDGVEFALGLIEPGKTAKAIQKVKLPNRLFPQVDVVSVSVFTKQHSGAVLEFDELAQVEESARPTYAYKVRVDDSTSGNGDGLLQSGEKATLTVFVKNKGNGKGEKTIVALNNLSGDALYLKEGRVQLNTLEVGEEKSGKFNFRVQKKTPEAKFQISIWDADLGSYLIDEFMLPIGAKAEKLVRKQIRRIWPKSKTGALIYSGASTESPVVGVLKPSKEGVKSDAVLSRKHWSRLVLPGGQLGFVQAQEVVEKASKNKIASFEGIVLNPYIASPSLFVEALPAVADEDFVDLKGRIAETDHVEDVMVFVNDHKVYYRSYAGTKSGKGDLKIPLNLKIKLEPGANTIRVVARKNDFLLSQRILSVYRKGNISSASKQ